MYRSAFLCVVFVALPLSQQAVSQSVDSVKAEIRTWTTRDKKHTTEAAFLTFKVGKVQLKRADGRVVAVPLRQLSTADQEYVRRTAKDDATAVMGLKERKVKFQMDKNGQIRAAAFRNGTRVGEPDMRLLKGLPNLEHLQLAGCRFDERILQELKDIPSLRRLDLSRTSIDNSGIRELRPLSHLKALSLDSTKITNAALSHIKHLSSLEELVLANNSVGDKGIRNLEQMPKLRKINLENTKVSPQGLVNLKRALGKPRIKASGVVRRRL